VRHRLSAGLLHAQFGQAFGAPAGPAGTAMPIAAATAQAAAADVVTAVGGRPVA
jgi:hypothetical protein